MHLLRFPNAKRSTSNVDSEVRLNDCQANHSVGRTSASHSPRLGHRKITRAPTKLLPVQSEFPAPSWSPTQVPRGRSPTRDRETNATQTFPPAVARKVPSPPCRKRSESDGHCGGSDRDHTSVRDTIAIIPETGHLSVTRRPTLEPAELPGASAAPTVVPADASHYPQRLPG